MSTRTCACGHSETQHRNNGACVATVYTFREIIPGLPNAGERSICPCIDFRKPSEVSP